MSEEGLGGVESDVPESFVVHAAAQELGGDGEEESGGDDPGEGRDAYVRQNIQIL